MKLSTLLLSSAALVVAGSAYAADLPAKKGAPAAKATGCPAFGSGYFQIPGGDTCIKFSGRVRVDNNFAQTSDTRKHDIGGTVNLAVEAVNNTEIGAVKSYLDSGLAGSVGYAYIQAAGMTMGKAASATSMANFGVGYGLGSDVTAQQLTYGGSAGALSFSVGLEDSVLTGSIASRPDVVAAISTTAGAMKVSAAAVSSETRASDTAAGAASNGYAYVGNVSANVGTVGVAVHGAYAVGASQYALGTRLSGGAENTAGTLSQAQSVGLQLSAAMGTGTAYLYAGAASSTSGANAKSNTTQYAVSYKQSVAKGLFIQPELVSATTDSAVTNTAYLRIQRDF